MRTFWQIASNLALYVVLVYAAVESTFIEPDFWFAFVVWFLLLVAIVITLIPGLHARQVSPGQYPYDD